MQKVNRPGRHLRITFKYILKEMGFDINTGLKWPRTEFSEDIL